MMVSIASVFVVFVPAHMILEHLFFVEIFASKKKLENKKWPEEMIKRTHI